MEIILSPSEPADVGYIVRVENEKGAAEFLNPDSREHHLGEMEKDHIRYLNILVDGDRKGYVLLALEEDMETVELRRIVIGEKGKGFGQEALQEVERYSKKVLQRDKIWLDVFEHNHRGLHVYRKLGYREFKRENREKGTLIFMNKSL